MTVASIAAYKGRFDNLFIPREIEHGVWYLAGYYVVLEPLLYRGGSNMWVICRNKRELDSEYHQNRPYNDVPRYYSIMKAFEVIRQHYAGLRFAVEYMESA